MQNYWNALAKRIKVKREISRNTIALNSGGVKTFIAEASSNDTNTLEKEHTLKKAEYFIQFYITGNSNIWAVVFRDPSDHKN